MANVPGVVTDPSRIKGGVVSLTSGGAQIPAYMARPNQPGNYPGIVVIQEAFGLVDHICDLARRFANIGYNACAPALYWRRGAPKDPDVMEQVFPVMFGLPDNEALQDLNAAIDCWGGFIHRATPDAETTPARPKAPLDMVGQLHCPLFGVFGEEDQNPPVALEAELKKRAQAAGKDVTTKIYKNAGHAFLADYRPSYREAAAQELWGDIQSYFGKHLK